MCYTESHLNFPVKHISSFVSIVISCGVVVAVEFKTSFVGLCLKYRRRSHF
jgi:hypothetical protein